jgi:hypothetical protein
VVNKAEVGATFAQLNQETSSPATTSCRSLLRRGCRRDSVACGFAQHPDGNSCDFCTVHKRRRTTSTDIELGTETLRKVRNKVLKAVSDKFQKTG